MTDGFYSSNDGESQSGDNELKIKDDSDSSKDEIELHVNSKHSSGRGGEE